MKNAFCMFSCILGLSFGLFSFYLRGAEIRDDFNAGNDNGWTRLEPLAPTGAPGSFTFPSGAYRIQAGASPDLSTLGPARAGSLRFDLNNDNFAETIDLVGWNNTLNQSVGLMARATNPGFGATDGYAFTYSTAGFISISLLVNEQITVLASTPVSLDSGRNYNLRFQGIGGGLFGGVYDPSDQNNLVAGVFVRNNTYSQGVTGLYLFSNVGNGGVDATFDNFRALTIVPEPSTMTLLLLCAAGVFYVALRRRGTGGAR